MPASTLDDLGARLPHAPDFGREALIVCDTLVRIYQTGTIEVQALQGLDLLVDAGEMIAVVGASGSGKSTLLAVLSGIDTPTAGRVRVGEWDLMTMSAPDRVRYRRTMVGFVWQQATRNLVPYLDAVQNVTLPLTFAGVPRARRRARALELLDLLGVGRCAGRLPREMSGGEQQRVAIATALANSPRVILADEPTGELDVATSHEVFDALRTANRDLGTTVVVVTHDPTVSDQVERTVAIRDGRTSSEVLRRRADDDGAVSDPQEYAVMDRAGRVQVPQEYREALALTHRVRVALETGHVGIWPAAPEDRTTEPGTGR